MMFDPVQGLGDRPGTRIPHSAYKTVTKGNVILLGLKQVDTYKPDLRGS